MKRIFLNGLAVLGLAVLCACQQIPSIGSQRDDLAELPNMEQEDQSELIEEWHDCITLSKIRESKSHCCYIRYQHMLKNLSSAIQTAQYKKVNPVRYRKIVDEYLLIARQETNLRFMTDCMEKQEESYQEVTNIKKTAIRALIDLNDDEIFSDLQKIFASADYAYPVQTVIADGLIKYLPKHESKDVKSDLVYRIMLIKKTNPQRSGMKEMEHLLGQCINLSSLNAVINKAKDLPLILELILDDNLDFWRSIARGENDFSEADALENIALLKNLAVHPISKKVDDLIFYTLCEIVPGESLAVYNTRFDEKSSFENLKAMLSYFYSFKKSTRRSSENISKLSNESIIIAQTQKLAQNYLYSSLEKLPADQRKEAFELYASCFTDMLLKYLCQRFEAGDASGDFYATAINTSLWMIARKSVVGKDAENLSLAVDKLLYSGRKRTDYKEIFTMVFFNKDSYLNMRREMIAAVEKGVKKQSDFVDCFIQLLAKFDGNSALISDIGFKKENLHVFDRILDPIDPQTLLEVTEYLKSQKEYDFLLKILYSHLFEKNKYHSSFPHLVLAGNIASSYLKNLQKDPTLYKKYIDVFKKAISDKNDDVSLVGSDISFRIISNPKERSEAQLLFEKRWPQLRNIHQKESTTKK